MDTVVLPFAVSASVSSGTEKTENESNWVETAQTTSTGTATGTGTVVVRVRVHEEPVEEKRETVGRMGMGMGMGMQVEEKEGGVGRPSVLSRGGDLKLDVELDVEVNGNGNLDGEVHAEEEVVEVAAVRVPQRKKKKEIKERENEKEALEQSEVTYDFSSLPKSMYMKAMPPPPAQDISQHGPTSINDMMKLKQATRERLKQQRLQQQRGCGRNDLFTNPDKYLTPSSSADGDREEVLFLENFRATTRQIDQPKSARDVLSTTDRSGALSGSPRKHKSPKKSARGGPGSPNHTLTQTATTMNTHNAHDRSRSPTHKQQKKKFIPPGPKPLPVIARPCSPPKPRPEVFLLPVQKVFSPRHMSPSPRARNSTHSNINHATETDFGYSSQSDDEGDVNPLHIQIAKQLENEERRLRDYEAEYKNYIKFMETLSTDQLQIQAPQSHTTDSWKRAKKAHEKIVPKQSDAETLKLAALEEEWNKLEGEKKETESVTIQRGTGKYILAALFGEKNRASQRKKNKKLMRKDSKGNWVRRSVNKKQDRNFDVHIPLDAFKDYKYEVAKVEEVGDLVDVVSLPSSYQGSTPPPSPRSLYSLTHGDAGVVKKKKKKKKKDRKQIEEEQKKLKEENDEYMDKRLKEREKLMLDLSKLNEKIPPRIRVV